MGILSWRILPSDHAGVHTVGRYHCSRLVKGYGVGTWPLHGMETGHWRGNGVLRYPSWNIVLLAGTSRLVLVRISWLVVPLDTSLCFAMRIALPMTRRDDFASGPFFLFFFFSVVAGHGRLLLEPPRCMYLCVLLPCRRLPSCSEVSEYLVYISCKVPAVLIGCSLL